jgi:hypothetical protein
MTYKLHYDRRVRSDGKQTGQDVEVILSMQTVELTAYVEL